MPTRPVFRRKKYIIKKGLQFRYIGLVFLLSLLVAIITGWTVFATVWTILGQKLANVYPQGRLVYVFRAANIALARNLVIVSPVIFLIGLFSSHRIAGPVYRLEKSIYEISKGNLGLRVKLRKGDEFRDLAELINEMTKGLGSNIRLTRDNALKLQKDVDRIRQLLSSDPPDRAMLKASLDKLQAEISDINASLSKYSAS